MTPNLTRLFKESKEQNFPELVETQGWFFHHGEALIAALERLTDYTVACEGLLNATPAKQVTDAQKLLAQLEAEAQP